MSERSELFFQRNFTPTPWPAPNPAGCRPKPNPRHKKTGPLSESGSLRTTTKILLRVVVHLFSFDVQRTTDQLDECHRSIVASTETALQNTKVTTRTLAITGAQLIKQLGYRSIATQARERQTTICYRIILCERDQRLSYPTELFSFRERRFDQLVLNQ